MNTRKQNGFDPAAGENLKDKTNAHFTASQSICILGIGKTKFYEDVKSGLLRSHFTMGSKKYFKGVDLLHYWALQMN